MPTKKAFLDAYRKRLADQYGWATDDARLGRFLQSVETTITTDQSTAILDGPACKAAWKDIGCKLPITYKAARALPAE